MSCGDSTGAEAEARASSAATQAAQQGAWLAAPASSSSQLVTNVADSRIPAARRRLNRTGAKV